MGTSFSTSRTSLEKGNSASTSNYEAKSLGMTKVNDSVWMLHNSSCQAPSMDIIFFHGLHVGNYESAFWKTWLAREDESVIWPKHWLGEAFPNARILSISYNISAIENLGQPDMYCLAENLVSDIIMDRFNIGQFCPIILVGHCFGGIVLKQFILSAQKRKIAKEKAHEDQSRDGSSEIETFLGNLKGVFYYGTPHLPEGSDIAKLANSSLCSSKCINELLENCVVTMVRIKNDFSKFRLNHNIRAFAIGESRATTVAGFHGFVVMERSARHDIDDYYTAVNADHFNVCRPQNKESCGIFRKLHSFILDTTSNKGVPEYCFFDNKQRLPEKAVGLDLVVNEVQHMLQEKAIMGIVGMGGIGKTTLAKALFNKLSPRYEYSCFVPDIKLISGTQEDVKKEVWQHMHHHGKQVADEKSGWFKLRRKSLLLVLDDVARDQDLEVLFDIVYATDGARQSHFILTSRDKDLLNRSNDISVFSSACLSLEDSKKLFLSYVLPKNALAPPWFETYVDQVVDKCGGLPLTLEVLGKYLKSSTNVEKIWEQTLEALDKAEGIAGMDERLWGKLRLSYDGLGEKEQEMFLDVTTFFKDDRYSSIPWNLSDVGAAWTPGMPSTLRAAWSPSMPWTLRDAKAAWSVMHGMEEIRWKILVDRSLVYDVGEDDLIKVHEQLLSLGHNIAQEPNKVGQRRVQEAEAAFEMLLSKDKKELHSLKLKLGKGTSNIVIPWSSLEGRLENLHYLDMAEYKYNIDISTPPLGEIIHYMEEYNYHIPTQPGDEDGDQNGVEENKVLPMAGLSSRASLHLEESILDMTRRLNDLTRSRLEENKVLPVDGLVVLRSPSGLHLDQTLLDLTRSRRLAVLKISLDNDPFSLGVKHLCSSLGGLRALKIFILVGAHLDFLPDEIGFLSQLERFELTYCDRLRTLPTTFDCLSRLKHLSLENCESLDSLPESFCRLSSLEVLKFESCASLHSLPESFGHLSRLKHLRFFHSSFHSLPESFGQLHELKVLDFVYCENLYILPESFGQLSSLGHLSFESCSNLHSLPDSFGNLRQLEHLSFESCSNLHTLPDSFGNLRQLEHLSFKSCSKLHTLSKSFGRLSTLAHLSFDHCQRLQILPSLQSFFRFPTLQFLEIVMCPKVDSLLFFTGESPPALRHLRIGWIALTSIPECVKSFPSLQILDISVLPYLNEFPPWLGGRSLGRPGISLCTFNVKDGKFALQRETQLDNEERQLVAKWLHGNLMLKVRASDLAGAMAAVEGAMATFDVVHPPMLSKWSVEDIFFLQEGGVLKRLAGDLVGALADLTHAMEICFDSYECRKHRGFVKYLMGDLDGARTDAERAIDIMPKDCEEWNNNTMQIAPGHRDRLGNDPVQFLGFTFPSRYSECMRDLYYETMEKVMEKVRASELVGALAAFDVVHPETLGRFDRGFFFRERGILKRLAGDLVGALTDLTNALELDVEDGKDDYECRKHRGFVKYLLDDLDGARTDAKRAMAIMPRRRMRWANSIQLAPGHRNCLGEDSVEFLEFSLL